MTRIIAPLSLMFLAACGTDIVPVDAGGNLASADAPLDADCDGFSVDEDCDDNNASVYPGAIDQCDSIDNDCDPAVAYDENGEVIPTSFGEPDLCVDRDDDSWTLGEDCDDNDAFVYPGATEVDNGIDDDCDGSIDEGFDTEPVDNDGDGYASSEDCDDSDASIHPGASETCDELDNDCDGDVDEGVTTRVYEDADGDGWGDELSGTDVCTVEDGFTTVIGDCDDTDADVNPDAMEVCGNDVDEDCDGVADDMDGDGNLTSGSHPDCDDTDAAVYYGATEVENGIDDDCDGEIDEGFGAWPTDADGDGYADTADCDDSDSAINPGASEYNAGIDGEDNDCDGSVDEDWRAVVEVTYPTSGYYQLNAALYTSGASLPAWTENDLESSGTTMSVEFTTSEYPDMSGACGVVLNVSENNPALDWLCVEWSMNESVAIDAWVNGTRYNQSHAEIWIADNGSGSCAVVIQEDSSSSCDPVDDT